MKHRILIIVALLAVALLDGGLKYLAITNFPKENDPTLSPVFALVLHKNPGITFNIAVPLAALVPITILIILGLASQAVKHFKAQPRVALGIISVIIGAASNLVDRIINGFTTDYLMFFKTSVINLADILIILGAIVILMYHKTNPRRQRA